MANPTTNYGFVLPTPTDLVTDLPADFDVALQGVDTRLKALQPGTTLGDLAYSSATANTNTRLGIGTTGQVLTVAAGVPSWAALSQKVLQVVSATTTTATSINTTTLTDTTITATITPTLATSKILVIISAVTVHFRAAGASSIGCKVLRGATSIGDFGADGWSASFATVAGITLCGSVANGVFTTLDSPSTTSATTYKMQGRLETTASSSSSDWQPGGKPSTITLIEIGA